MALEERTRAWYTQQRRMSYVDTSAALTQWKRTGELAFLNEVSSVPLQQALRHLQAAFAAFFDKRARYPRFKSRRKSRASAEYTRSAFNFRDGELTLAKMTGPLDIVWSRPLPEGAEPSTVTVSKDAAGRWFCSILCQDTIMGLDPSERAVGVDAGVTSLVTLSTGEKVARIHARITDRRRDFLHKLSTRLVHENQVVVIEDLNVRNMVQNHNLARAISDAAWRQLRTMLEYKADWYGRDLVVIDRWFPSTRTCSQCATITGKMPLNVREWECGGCGARHDRDVNAARNIVAAGLAVSACGAGVRPQRESSRTGQSATKQEAHGATRGTPRL